MTVTRRRFLTIASAAALVPLAGRAAPAAPVTQWRGVALGAEARLILAHPDADRMVAAALDELARLEAIFSLYRPGSELMRLNQAGALDAPSAEMVELLSLAGLVHRATGGRFDPTIQPLWAAYAQAGAAGRAPTAADRAAALARTGWEGVALAPGRVALDRPGMALTLNGIAQGYVTDRVSARLTGMGMTDLMCAMGEIAATGHAPDGGDWPVTLTNGRAVPLRGRALASSAPRATCFDRAGRLGHIIDPRSGLPSDRPLALVSVSAPSAALADALSTAGCLMTRPELDRAAAAFDGVRVEAFDPLPA
ncbi:FAD:protein FMN transferase [Paracoccus luteus]|uniref:FAD:protein FMN transferase n=1 Tax=Paracoccus luteus TaxID=2508543 RepID=UPI00107043FE|nr:FAD:protein FMN transferase [Paracoccus luteus]